MTFSFTRLNVNGLLLWGLAKDKVFQPPSPTNVNGQKNKITKVTKDIMPNTQCCIWEEINYLLDVCCITAGSHNTMLQTTGT
jgi:hypothetical protein